MSPDFLALQEAFAGEYSLERELGRGGMGAVYLAREVQLDRLVAIKVLPESLAAQPDVRERFLREARTAASLSHPHIVPIYRVGETRGFVYFVMAYVEGQTLGERLRTRGPLTPAAATRLLREVTWALSYSHGRGVIHRDIKPDNILIEANTERALVTDFGIALASGDTGASPSGRVMGTAHFMSPEQATAGSVDGRSDLYSLGVVAYLALSGKLPFEGPSVPALLAHRVSHDAPALATITRDVPPALSATIDKCLRTSPDDRFASGEQLAEALDAASSPARTKMPVALRVWTQASDPLRSVYMMWSSIFTMGFLSELGRDHQDSLTVLAFALLPLIPLTTFHARKAYQALAAGYTLRDLRAALAAWQQERREDLTFEHSDSEPRWARLMRWGTYAVLGASGTLMSLGAAHRILPSLVVVATVGAALVLIPINNALGVRLFGRRTRARFVGRVRSAIWNSQFGEWAAKLLTPRNRTPVIADYRPTEMALGLAAEELFSALPKAYREHLSDLPAVARSLEAHAAAARARVAELDALAALGGAERSAKELATARGDAKRQLAESVAALESMRLDLLRLHGGATDLRPITTVLEAARELGRELGRVGEAQQEIERIVPSERAPGLPLDLRPHTPT